MELLVVIPVGLLIGFVLGNMLCGYKPWAPFIPFTRKGKEVYMRPDKWGLTRKRRERGAKEVRENIAMWGRFYRDLGSDASRKYLELLGVDPRHYENLSGSPTYYPQRPYRQG